MGQDPGDESSQASWARTGTAGCPGSTKPFSSPVTSTPQGAALARPPVPSRSPAGVQHPQQHPCRSGSPRPRPTAHAPPPGTLRPTRGHQAGCQQGGDPGGHPGHSTFSHRGAEPPPGLQQAPSPSSHLPPHPSISPPPFQPPRTPHLPVEVPRSHGAPPAAASTPALLPAAPLWPLIAANWGGGVRGPRPAPPPAPPHSPSRGQRSSRGLGLVSPHTPRSLPARAPQGPPVWGSSIPPIQDTPRSPMRGTPLGTP